MKRYGMLSLGISFIIVFLFVIAGRSTAGIKGTKHDLSSAAPVGTGPGPIRATSFGGTSQICVFCHTPHGAAATIARAPLWNKSFTTDPAYTVYTSDVLSAQGLNYPAAESPVLAGKSVHLLKTRLCLSCHDGTIALGKLANLPFGFVSDIPMAGTTGTTDVQYAMPHEAAGYIGIDLRDDHPVAIPHKSGLPPGADPQLNAPGAPVNNIEYFTGNKVRVFVDSTSGNAYVECTSCHDAHDNTNGYFLVEKNTGSQVCTRCHNKTGYTGSIHDTSTLSYSPPDGTAGGNLGLTVGGVKCMDCHFPHKAGITDTSQLPKATPLNLALYSTGGYYLLTFREEMSCFNDQNRWGQTPVNACHGTNATITSKNIESLVAPTKTSGHWVGNYTGLHQATEAQSPSGGWAGAANFHVECQDCHNPHTAGNTSHAKGTNQVSSTSSLYGTGGVAVSSWPLWSPGLSGGSYNPTTVKPIGVTSVTDPGVTFEYQICLKCHSDFAWNPATPPSSPTFGGSMTNQAMEFNPANPSYHPVAQSTGRTIGSLVGAWNVNKGTQTMYCSDCHNNDVGAPNGPHGSNNPSILVANFADTITAVGTNQPAGDLCFTCHSMTVYMSGAVATAGTGFSDAGGNNLHVLHRVDSSLAGSNRGYRCVNCHARISHGYGNNRKAMITVTTDSGVAAYAPVGGPLITNAPLATSGNYLSGLGNRNVSCLTVSGCH